MRRVVILQPSYIPWLGYFDQINKSDIFVFFDDVQYTRRDWRNRNRIKLLSGEACFLTVPVCAKNNYHASINQIAIDASQEWKNNHLATLRCNYAKSDYFKDIYSIIEDTFEKIHTHLAPLCIDVIKAISRYLGIEHPQFFCSSDLSLQAQDSTDRLIKICQLFNATHYLTGDSAASYLEEGRFKANTIVLEYHNYVHPCYKQFRGDFISHLSILDLLFNEGPKSLEILSGKAHKDSMCEVSL